MSQSQSSVTAQDEIASTYERNGFVVPIDVLSQSQAQRLRADLETAEAELASDSEKLALLKAYPDRLLPSFDALTRNETLMRPRRRCWARTLWFGALDFLSKRPTRLKSYLGIRT